MFILFTYFFISCSSQYPIDSTIDNITTISYEETAIECSDLVRETYSTPFTYFYIFKADTLFYNEELIIDFLNYPTGSIHNLLFGQLSYEAPNLKVVRIKTNNINTQWIYTNYTNDNTHFYVGCFNGDNNCESFDYHYIYVYSISFTVFLDGASTTNYLYYNNDNSNDYPYIFIGAISSFTIYVRISINEDNYSYEYFTNLSGSFYLLTSFNINTNFYSYIDYTTSSPTTYDVGFTISSVCSRKDTNRSVLFNEDHTPYTNCSCWTKNNDTSITNNSLFNYPDCIHNSTMFDLILPSSSLTYSLSDDLLEWYSIQFTNSSQSIEINEGKTLIIDELDINQDDISFNENVIIKNLIVRYPDSYFDTLNFYDINYDELKDDEVVFTTQSTLTNLGAFLLELNGTDVLIKPSCIYNGSGYLDRLNIEMDQCTSYKLNEDNELSLLIQSPEYIVNENEYWNSLVIDGDEVYIGGTAQLKPIVCEFENKTITINCNLYCTIMNINSNTKLINNGVLIINNLVVTDVIDYNLNENGIIESQGSIVILSINFTTTQSNCFELISSNDSLTYFSSIHNDYLTLLLSQNQLLRICPLSIINYKVQCTTIGNTFEHESFEIIHCPCYDENCTINVNTTQLDTRNIEFNGIFNVLTNSTIAISYKTSSFTVEYGENKQILLIGNGAVGFEVLNTNTLKSETTTLSIHSSNQLPCKSLLIQNNNQQCIIEDNTTHPNVGDNDNCHYYNGYGCEICYEGYEINITYCNKCLSNCLRCYNGSCINCEMNYQLNETNQCELISNDLIKIFDNNKIMKCNDGYYSNTNQCIKCSDDDCVTCNSSQCLTCNNSIILNNGNCQSAKPEYGEELISNYGVINCINGYYINNSQCIDCSLTFDNCELCNNNECLSCNENYILINDGSCSLNINCLNTENSICLSCNDKGSWFNGNECIECGDNCKNCINGKCIECEDDHILVRSNTCIKNGTGIIPDYCLDLTYRGICKRCKDGYFVNIYNLCERCSNECASCYNSTYCFECNNGYILNNNNTCIDRSKASKNCCHFIPGNYCGCAICNDGYYRLETLCYPCIDNCTKCHNDYECDICADTYFISTNLNECISYGDLTNCKNRTRSGCSECCDGYYLEGQYCNSCNSKNDNCNTCNKRNGECLTCHNDYILINYECIHYQLIDNCEEAKDSKCIKCSFWHTPTSNGDGCLNQVVWWVIVLIIMFIIFIITIFCVVTIYFVNKYLNHKKFKKIDKEVTMFDMKHSNIQFIPTNNKDVVISTDELLFNNESKVIPVNEETIDLICVGNTSKHTIKVQFSVKEGCDKYEIRTNPQLITIPKRKVVKFEIFIKPLCTCKIDDQIMLISVNFKKGKTITTLITINTQTVMTTILDYDELIEYKKLGEGSFGIVYKGTFRGNQVAIKKLKQLVDNTKSMKEFNKEVSMLDKFRNEYIVHFYGAVMIPNKVCMVTEFAQYGSLQDLMNKRKDKPIDNTMKMKILLDCAKGISYLHSNGILHRDIKPDNFLVISLDKNVKVNAKLTDFGSSKNINMLMTNMTFTNGIGSPAYMAPEILIKEKYKKPADVYSFAITMYETFIWEKAYPKEIFIYAWDIARFVIKGDRLSKPDTMNESIYPLITNCWKQEVNERYKINDVTKQLEAMYFS